MEALETDMKKNSINSLFKFSIIKKRHVLAIYAFFGFFVAYIMRANLSVAIVEMSKNDFRKNELILLTESLNKTDIHIEIVCLINIYIHIYDYFNNKIKLN